MPAQIDYTSRDYAGLRQFLLDVLGEALPEWTSRNPNDPGVVMVELFAYLGDILSYYTDRVANEAFIATASQRRSVLDIARMLNYVPAGVQAATCELTFTAEDPGHAAAIEIPAGTLVATDTSLLSDGDPVYFTTDVAAEIAVGDSTVSVAATEGLPIDGEPVASSDGTVGQEYPLFERPVVEGSVRVYVDTGGGEEEWTYYSSIIDASDDERAFTTRTDENDAVFVVFGDNANGLVPPVGASITADYAKGAGSRGNVGQGLVNTVVDPVSGLSASTPVTNSAASGGLDAESTESIRTSAPRSIRTVDRAVTLTDYENLAYKASPNVAKVKALAAIYTSVVIYVATSNGADDIGTASATSAKDAVEAYFGDGRKLIGVTVTTADPTYQGIDVEVSVNVDTNYDLSSVQQAVENSLRDLFAFSNVRFGQRVTLLDVYRAMQVDGVLAANVDTLDLSGGAGAVDVALAENEIPTLDTLTVNVTGGV